MADEDALEVAACQMAVGKLVSEELPELAAQALVRGVDSPALRELAGQRPDDVRASGDLFRVALSELGIDLPDSDVAEWRLACRVAAEIVAGTIEAENGARKLWRASHRVQDRSDLLVFAALATELEESPGDTDDIKAEIIAAAQNLLSRFEYRWIDEPHGREAR